MNEWLATRARALGVDDLAPDEISLLLNLAGDAAHESGARTNAPLLCYLLGRAQGERTLAELAELVRSTS
ncbi:MAG TPA: DUF6457 domain-containing protein [Gaiellaceae bacterium]